MTANPKHQAVASAPGHPDAAPSGLRAVHEADAYERSVAGVNIEVVRIGEGKRTTRIGSRVDAGIIASSVDVGFPMLARTEISEDNVIVGAIQAAPPGANWCGIDLAAGDVLVYAPGAVHTASNPVDTAFSFAVFEIDRLRELADRNGHDLVLPDSGSVTKLAPTARLGGFADMIDGFLSSSGPASFDLEDAALDVVSLHERKPRRRGPEALDDAALVARCVAAAAESDWTPSVRQLAREVGASDRRVREAFRRTYGVPPSDFLRSWRLDQVRRTLIDPAGAPSVTQAASHAGLHHFGRLSRHYAEQFGELPSETLKGRVEAG